jgi:3-isopropylmalate/(R)-2-methylmalate dehydratase small subunit
MSLIISGKVWKFGNDINTDYMHPAFGRDEPWEKRKRYILHIHKRFTEDARPGDVIVAGDNFGCGSSREGAPANLKRLGIGCVVAESFGRIFFRNCIAVALPVMACRGVSGLFSEGNRLRLDFETALLKNLTTGRAIQGLRLSTDLIDIVKEGGILELLKKEKRGGKNGKEKYDPA